MKSRSIFSRKNKKIINNLLEKKKKKKNRVEKVNFFGTSLDDTAGLVQNLG